MERLDKYRSQVNTRSGPASYIDTGGPGRVVLFVHGVGSSSYLWRHVIDQLDGERRCVAFDLPLHGRTPAAADQDFSLPGLARFLADCWEALELTGIDVVANDTGGAISQVFAVGRPERLHTLTLTNCEAHDNVPPKALLPGVLLARMGLFAPLAPRMVRDIPRARKRVYGSGYQDVASLPDDIVRAWLRHRRRRDRRCAAVLPRRAGHRTHRGAAPPLGHPPVTSGCFPHARERPPSLPGLRPAAIPCPGSG
jgi:pimeloyl-ACP methyl ester carboxylesterase